MPAEVIEALTERGRVRLTLEEYLEDKDCLCDARGTRTCFCAGEDVTTHLARLEEGGFGRARILDKKQYLEDYQELSRRRPVLLRAKKTSPKPF